MLDALLNLCERTKALNSDAILNQALAPTQLQYDILELNKSQLYEKGQFADGTPTPDYSSKTIAFKIEKGQRYDHMTFLDTGEFYASFKFINQATQFKIKANNTIHKSDNDKDRGDLGLYGQIEGLTDESLQTVQEWVLPSIQQLTLKALQG